MREIRSSGSVEGVMRNHDPYSDCAPAKQARCIILFLYVVLASLSEVRAGCGKSARPDPRRGL
jgi:hypothetical protein